MRFHLKKKERGAHEKRIETRKENQAIKGTP